jgi:hemerythrin-like domain-containing protein
MSIFLTLTKEHQLFQQMITRLEHCLKYDEKNSHTELRRILLVLLPALSRHEELEDLIFQDPICRNHRAAPKLLAMVDSQHRKLEAIHEEISELLRTEGQYDLGRLRDLIFTLCEKLRLHFHTEETSLWPNYNQTMSRSLAHSVNVRAHQQVRRLEREIQETWSVVSDYVR